MGSIGEMTQEPSTQKIHYHYRTPSAYCDEVAFHFMGEPGSGVIFCETCNKELGKPKETIIARLDFPDHIKHHVFCTYEDKKKYLNSSRIYALKEFPKDSPIEPIVVANKSERKELLESLVGECGFSKEIEFLAGLSDYERIMLLDIIKEYIVEKK